MSKYILILLLIVSCKPAKTITNTHFVKDSIVTHKETTIQLPVKNVTIIENPCKDSILKPFNQVIESGKTKVTLKEYQGNVYAEINIDSIVSSDLKEFKSKVDKEHTETIITQYKSPKYVKWLIYFSIVSFLYLAYRIARIFYLPLRALPK